MPPAARLHDICSGHHCFPPRPNKEGSGNVLEPLQMKPKGWVGFWKTPLYPGLYGQKPNFLGDNLSMVKYTGR
jgi:hypothetical protein